MQYSRAYLRPAGRLTIKIVVWLISSVGERVSLPASIPTWQIIIGSSRYP